MRIRNSKAMVMPGLLLLAWGLLAACGSDAANGSNAASGSAAETPASTPASTAEEASVYPMTVTDELGHEVTIPSKPAKIFAPTMEDSLLALGIEPAMQWSNGVEPQLYLQDRLGDVPEISFAGGAPSFEAILSHKPDFIILHNSFYAENGLYESYAKIAPTYVFKSASADLNGTIETLGRLLNARSAAEQALKVYADKAETAKTKLAPLSEGKKAAIIRFNAKGMFFMNGNYFSGYVLAHDLGFAQSSLVSGGALDVSLEILPELDADYIFLVKDGSQGDQFLNELKESNVWKSMPAVKNGNVYETESDYWLSGGLIAQGKVIDDVVRFLAP